MIFFSIANIFRLHGGGFLQFCCATPLTQIPTKQTMRTLSCNEFDRFSYYSLNKIGQREFSTPSFQPSMVFEEFLVYSLQIIISPFDLILRIIEEVLFQADIALDQVTESRHNILAYFNLSGLNFISSSSNLFKLNFKDFGAPVIMRTTSFVFLLLFHFRLLLSRSRQIYYFFY